jgi:hypothetical protein
MFEYKLCMSQFQIYHWRAPRRLAKNFCSVSDLEANAIMADCFRTSEIRTKKLDAHFRTQTAIKLCCWRTFSYAKSTCKGVYAHCRTQTTSNSCSWRTFLYVRKQDANELTHIFVRQAIETIRFFFSRPKILNRLIEFFWQTWRSQN